MSKLRGKALGALGKAERMKQEASDLASIISRAEKRCNAEQCKA